MSHTNPAWPVERTWGWERHQWLVHQKPLGQWWCSACDVHPVTPCPHPSITFYFDTGLSQLACVLGEAGGGQGTGYQYPPRGIPPAVSPSRSTLGSAPLGCSHQGWHLPGEGLGLCHVAGWAALSGQEQGSGGLVWGIVIALYDARPQILFLSRCHLDL